MKMRANVSVYGITRGNCYDIIERDGNFIKIIRDDGTVGYCHIGAFDKV